MKAGNNQKEKVWTQKKKKRSSSNLLNICNCNLFSNQLTESSKWTLTANMCLPNTANKKKSLCCQCKIQVFTFQKLFISSKGQFWSHQNPEIHNNYHFSAYILRLQNQIFTFYGTDGTSLNNTDLKNRY